ncbi:trypsin-like peptidase domain-containing protein [Cytophaga aurantiaca]|uniref:trypsin-like peptidase domain-containing protein n=1 Tax=Cytophaga aurantiaca TaxID=29530 RepID=UPI00035CB9B3|nr:trypsin-like peptidase domain-containing protein [Cytophaga aurantiaca]
MKHILTLAIALTAGFIGAFLFQSTQPSENIISDAPSYSTHPVAYTPSLVNTATMDFTAASAISTPSVVYITTVSANQNSNNWFDWYFNGNGNNFVAGSGSGVIFSHDGYIITNNHVIQRAEKIEVVHNKTTYQAKIIGTDPSSDLAVLKIEAENLPAITLGNSSLVKIGEWVLAVGNPFNLTSTVTAGIVSAKGRNINVVNSRFPIESFIQTDAAINPGNSGGALVNTKGELIGINTAILSQTGSYTGYGFSVPVDIVKKVVSDLIKYGVVQKAFIGVEVNEINSSIAKQLDLSSLDGTYVTYLQKDGAAEKAGLLKNDILLKLDEKIIESRSDFDEYIAYKSPGDKIKIAYKRNNTLKETYVTLTNEEGTNGIVKRELFSSTTLGADFSTIPKVEKDKMGLQNGVRIVNVRNGLISRLGLQEGFIITAINRAPVSDPNEVIRILENIRGQVIIEGIASNGARSFYQYYF